MAVFWILFVTVFQIFRESTSAPVKPLFENLRFQYVVFLVPPSNELPELTKFLTNIKSAVFLDTSENYGMVQVVCDPDDWVEIYRYTKDREIHLPHWAYFIEKSEYPTLEQLRLRKDELREIGTNESPGNWISRQKIEDVEEKKYLKNLNTEVFRVLTNGRIPKTEKINPQLSVNENSSEKTLIRSIIDTESQGSSFTAKFFDRLKRYSWDLVTKNFHFAYDNNEIKNLSVVQSRSTPSDKTIETKGTISSSRESWNTKNNAMVSEKDAAVTRTKTTNDVMAPNALSAISELEKNKLTGFSNAGRIPSIMENIVKVYSEESEEMEVAERSSLKLERNRRELIGNSTEKVLEDSTTTEEAEEEEGEEEEEEESGGEEESEESDEGDDDEAEREPKDNDHSNHTDHDCSKTDVAMLDKLAECIHSILNWVKELEARGKKG